MGPYMFKKKTEAGKESLNIVMRQFHHFDRLTRIRSNTENNLGQTG